MKTNEVIHGFRIVSIRQLDEIKTELYEMEHLKTSARAIWLKRDDENKTFSIAFKTTPVDDTGVFHILEHSVLNGSVNYPVKEPFVDLLKGSLQTFLNAMTFPDKTVYPVSSRNDKDFCNLMRIYLDAVFHPLAVTHPNIYRQEGWHYELNDVNAEPLYKGVVFNEMKGAFSNPESVRGRAMMHALFPDNCYGYESGGDPRYITDLSWQQFCDSHAKYYNPSNSYICLDGDMDIEKILEIIDSEYLCHYDSSGELITITKQEPHIAEDQTIDYEISAEEDTANRTLVSYGYVVSMFDEQEKNTAFRLLASVLTGSNEAPLKKAILSNSLAEDISFSIEDGIYQPFVEISVTNTSPDKLERLEETIRNTLKDIVRDGVDREELEATLNKAEFAARESDFGSAPKGLVYAISSLDTWLYGGDPAKALLSQNVFRSLREKIGTGYYEKLLEDFILNSTFSAKVILNPSKTLGAEKLADEKKRLADIKASWSKEELNGIVEMNREFSAWQKLEDTPEQKATIPQLHIADLNRTAKPQCFDICRHGGTNEVIRQNIDTNGITYVSLISDISDFTLEEYNTLSTLLDVLTNLATEKYSVLKIRQLMKRDLGSFNMEYASSYDAHTHEERHYVFVNYSCLSRNDEVAADLVKEILYRTRIDDSLAIINLLRQKKTNMENAFSSAGHALAVKRADSYNSASGLIEDNVGGYDCFKYVRKIESEWDTMSEEVMKKLRELYVKLFIRERLTVSVAAENKPLTVKALLDDAPHGTVGPKADIRPLGRRNEGIIVPANISYAGKSAVIEELFDKFKSRTFVLSNILSFGYLWTRVRVMGGAYGAGTACNKGKVRMYSFRDPNPANTLNVFEKMPEAIEEFITSGEDVEKYIIGSMGDFDPLLTNKLQIRKNIADHLSGLTDGDNQERLDLLLTTTADDIKQMAEIYRKANENGSICVIGKKEALMECQDRLDDIHIL